MDPGAFSPRDFLKARRPERFSDSISVESPELDRSILEYHLDSLTSRSQEADFERFAKSLAQEEICPNLLPQTGPTGGGDSKVDSETYPVADSIAATWYVGVGSEAATERWAFAFSAKKDWRPKVRSDVEKIAKTNRGYRKAFFVTNQFVRDRARADVEDELTKSCGFDVRILDRSWILDRIFRGGHEELAARELRLSLTGNHRTKKGPLDAKKESTLEETEARIKNAGSTNSLGFQFVEDCIRVAALARELERARTEVDGLFLRAQRAADTYGTHHQQVVCRYEEAWTTYWWHEDYIAFVESYSSFEHQVGSSENPYHFELWSNLWHVLQAGIRTGAIVDPTPDLASRSAKLAAELTRLEGRGAFPSIALYALTLRLRMQLQSSDAATVDGALRALQDAILEARTLMGFPLLPLIEVLFEAGSALGESDEYESIIELAVEVSCQRDGEVAAARLLLKRGVQCGSNNAPYDAIRYLGRALGKLYKEESRSDLVKTLYFIGVAYEEVGLLWAARGSLLTAASMAFLDYQRYGKITRMQASCLNRLKWIELRIGRVPQALDWHVESSVLTQALVAAGNDVSDFTEGDEHFDPVLGILLLRAGVGPLVDLESIPDVLESIELPGASIALQFALGYETDLPKELLVEGESFPFQSFFCSWKGQPASEDLPHRPSLGSGRRTTLESGVLGCEISVETDVSFSCLAVAESLLSALESLLSTGFSKGVIAKEPKLEVMVRHSDFVGNMLEGKLMAGPSGPIVEVRCSDFDPQFVAHADQVRIKDQLLQVVVSVMASAFLVPDEHVLSELVGSELGLQRALDFTSSIVTQGNVFGRKPRIRISDWSDPESRKWPLVRSDLWDAVDGVSFEPDSGDDLSPAASRTQRLGDVSSPATSPSHPQMKTLSLIRESLWEEAEWAGMAYAASLDSSMLPLIVLLFRNEEPAGRIFVQWLEELGAEDTDEKLRISMVRGVSRDAPHTYRVLIGSNPALGFSPKVEFAFILNRICTMEPTSSRNLDGFLMAYARFGQYHVTYATVPEDESVLSPVLSARICKRELFVREAWELGRGDLEAATILPTDDPIVPSTVQEPPVVKLLKWLRTK